MILLGKQAGKCACLVAIIALPTSGSFFIALFGRQIVIAGLGHKYLLSSAGACMCCNPYGTCYETSAACTLVGLRQCLYSIVRRIEVLDFRKRSLRGLLWTYRVSYDRIVLSRVVWHCEESRMRWFPATPLNETPRKTTTLAPLNFSQGTLNDETFFCPLWECFFFKKTHWL